MNTKALGIAIVLAAIGAGTLLFYIKRFERQTSGGKPISVLYAVQEIPLGEVLKEHMLEARPLPESYVEERHIHASEASRVLGVRVQNSIKPNESVLWSDLATTHKSRDLSSLVQTGMRAITISATQSSTFGGLLRPGDRVDILFTEANGSKDSTRPLLQNILVLAAGADTENTTSSRPRAFNQITVSATMDQSQLLAHAKLNGTLTLVLRNPNDIKIIQDLPETSTSDLQQQSPESVTQPTSTITKEIENVK